MSDLPVLAAETGNIANAWWYVAAGYGVTFAVLIAYAAWTIVRGRRLGRQLPPEDRRWL